MESCDTESSYDRDALADWSMAFASHSSSSQPPSRSMAEEPPQKRQRADDGAAVPTHTDAATAASSASATSATAASSAAAPQPAAPAHKELPAAQRMRDDELGLKLLKQGAEGCVYEGVWFGRPCIVKERFRKLYRHPQLEDTLSTERLKAEVRALAKARKQTNLFDPNSDELGAVIPAPAGAQPLAKAALSVPVRPVPAVYTPAVYLVDEEQKRIVMERIEGVTVKEAMHKLNLSDTVGGEQLTGLKIAAKIGRAVAAIHEAG